MGYYFISLLGGIQGILLSTAFYRKQWNNTAARLLCLFVFAFSIGLFERIVHDNIAIPFIKHLLLAFICSSCLLYGPLVYLFVHYLINKQPFRKTYLIHFAPFVLNIFLYTLSVFLPGPDSDLLDFIFFELFVIQLITYTVLAIIKLSRYRKLICSNFSSINDADYSWLRGMLLFTLFIYVLSFIITHLIAFGFRGAEQYYTIVQFSITAFIYLFCYKLLMRPQLFSLENIPVFSATSLRYERSGLTGQAIQDIMEQIKEYMIREKPFVKHDCSLGTFSDGLSLSRNHITQVLNDGFKKTFYEFVNEYRVEEAKLLMADSANDVLTMEAIGGKAGFKSKTAFNTNFKKLTGYTPTVWKTRCSGM